MDSNEDEDLAFNVLTDLGLDVTRVPRKKKAETPEFTATDREGGRYVVEVKTRRDPAAFDADLAAGRLATTTVRLDPHFTIAERLKKAASQIATRRQAPTDFSLVCYVIDGFSPLMHVEQLIATLWGAVKVFDIDTMSSADAYSQLCFYLEKSAFENNPDIDGVLTLVPSGTFSCGFYPNRFSPRRIEKSVLGCALKELGAVKTPEDAKATSGVLIADFSLPDFRSRLLDIQKRTGRRRLSPMMSSGFQSAFAVGGSDPSP